jgi:hypothetical protein
MGFLRNYLVFLLTVCFLVNVGAQTQVTEPFSKIKVSGNIKAELIPSTSPKVEYTVLEGDPNDLVIDVLGDQLEIRFKNTRFWEYFQNTKAKVKIYYTKLDRLDCAAGSKVVAVNNICSKRLYVDASSGASCDLAFEGEEISVDGSSGAEIRLQGNATSISFDVSSGAELDAFELITQRASGDASSGAQAKVHCSQHLDADASSGGEVKFRGKPASVNKQSSSGGSVRAL